MNLIARADASRCRPLVGYGLAIVTCLAALAVRMTIGGAIVGFPFFTFLPAIALTTFFGGLRPAIVAVALAAALAHFFLIAPAGSFANVPASGFVAIVVFCFSATVLIAPIEAMFLARGERLASEKALRRLNVELERRVAERTAELEEEMRERAMAEGQLRQIQKMEAIGRLTGGIAHDFNNMLAIVIGSLDVTRRRLTGDENPRIAAGIGNALEGARRAASLTARLLAFSRQQPLEPQTIDVNKLVGGMSEMLRRTLGETIIVETVLAGGLWRSFADPAQLESALVNLAVNARDAMPSGGKLTIETSNADLDDRYAQANEEVAAGQYVLVSVTDAGGGMSAEVIDRAFDPFYTTKDVGKGTGLGLSQVYGFVKQSRGHVKIYSEPGRGTTVKLYMPRHEGAPVGTSADRAAPGETAPLGDAGTIILVAEDEEQVRRMTVDALRSLGYTVVQASDGRQALEQLVLQPRIDLLFTDVMMPGMTGRELADAAREKRPDIKVLFTTGYTRNAVVHNGILDSGVAFLPKPFTVDQLAIKIARVLRGEGANR